MPPRNEQSETMYTEKPSITEVIERFKQEPNTVQSQIDFCRDMAGFANDESLHVLLAKQEGISNIIKAIENYKENVDLIVSACQTLLKMTVVSDANCTHIYKQNGIALFAECLQIHIDEADLLLIILDILGHLAMSEDTNIVASMLEKSCHTVVLSTMSRHGDNCDIVKQCCFILSHLVNTVETARSLMFIGGVHVIIGIMQKYKDNNEVLENGCRALGSFAVHDEICMDVSNAGAVQLVVQALEQGEKDEILLECSIWALACLTKYDEACQELCNTCAIEHLVKAMKYYPRKETIQEYGCWTICYVVAHKTNLQKNISAEIVKVFLDAISMFSENIDLQEQILITMSEIITNDDSNLNKFIANNGVRLTINTMLQYPDHCQIQEHGCRIIGNAAVEDKYRLNIETEGGSKVVVSAMLTLDNCEEMQEVGCLALTNITANVHKNKQTAVKSGCITAVLNALNTYGGSEHIVLSGLKTICNVIEIDEACYNFLEENGLNIFATVLPLHRDCSQFEDIQLFAGNVLSMISSILGLHTNYLNQAENLLSRIKESTGEHPEAILCFLRFYENLLRTEEGYLFCKEKHSLEIVCRWMDTFPEDISIQKSGCKVIAAISLYDKHCNTEMLNVVEKCMRNYTENSDIQLICCGTIVYVADKNEMFRECLLQRNIIPLLLSAMKANASTENVIDVGMMAVDTVLGRGEKIPEDKDEIFQFVSDIICSYPENIEIQIHGCNILSKLQCQQKATINTQQTQSTCNHIVNVLKRRRSNGELQISAVEALNSLLSGEPDSFVESTKQQMMFLKLEWNTNRHQKDF